MNMSRKNAEIEAENEYLAIFSRHNLDMCIEKVCIITNRFNGGSEQVMESMGVIQKNFIATVPDAILVGVPVLVQER